LAELGTVGEARAVSRRPAAHPPGELLAAARAAYAARDWITARDRYRAVGDEALAPDDLYALANSSWWLGDLDTALPDLQRAYRSHLDGGRPRAAALVALDIGYTNGLRGDESQASGWLGRAARLLHDQPECAEKGYLTYLDYEEAFGRGDLDAALALALEISAAGRRFGDQTLAALGVLGQGRVTVARGEVSQGMALLDEAMVAAVSDELDPGWAGNIYCNLMVVCFELADWARAGEWTTVTARWCEAMPGAGPFMGICRIHRAQVLQAHGAWDDAEAEARRVCVELADFHPGMVGEGRYALGDLQRQRGDLGGAEAAYLDAHRLGRDPCPGLSLLRLAQGRRRDAVSSITRALAATPADRLARARLLPAAVQIMLATDDLDQARRAADELGSVAATYGTLGLQAQADAAHGTVLLAEGRPAEAVDALERALRSGRQLRLPYEGACIRLHLAEAHRALGHQDLAALEAEAARHELARLGAVPSGAGPRPAPRADGLSPREVEVLGLVADGRSNQEVASELFLSVRTVERHLATAYRKLGLSGRSARAAAVRHLSDVDRSGG
jgi:ATP/maltotriose-dependent transcriptional regulator MalT